MRARHNHKITGLTDSMEGVAPQPAFFAAAEGSITRWKARNAIASAILLAVIGFRLIGPSQPADERGRSPQATIQTADWLDDIIEILKGGGGSPPPPPPPESSPRP